VNWSDCLIIFIIGGVVTGALIPVVSRFCFRWGLVDMPGAHKRHRFPTPNLGGISIFIGFWATVAFAYYRFPALSGELGQFIYYIVTGGVIMFLVGLIDDLGDVPALVKLLVQIVTSLILYMGGLRITVLFVPVLGPITLGYLSLPVTLLWVVGVTNSINLIDGLDGLAAGVSAIAALALLFVGVAFSLVTVIVFAVALMGVSLVFLYFNHYPAKIFLGDSGSLFLGYLFAVTSILFPIKSYTAAAVFVPLAALGVPITETVVSFIRRTATGRKFYKADNRHLFHYLAQWGLTKGQVVWLFYLLSAIFAVFSGAMLILNKQVIVTILALFMVVIFAVLFKLIVTRARKNRETESP
jgi:UDP-GlcNAc:undecaprenyl-phosphate GlcNAc-1-phosphate transferase